MDIRNFKLMQWNVKISDLPNTIIGKASWLKQQFDDRGDQLADLHNKLIDNIVSDYYTKDDIQDIQLATSTGLAKNIYDPTNKNTDVFAYADNAVAHALPAVGQPGQVLEKTETGVEWKDKNCVYTFDSLLNGGAAYWALKDGVYSQTAFIAGMTEDFNVIAFTLKNDTDKEARKAKRKAASYITHLKTDEGKIIFYCDETIPAATITLHIKGVFDHGNTAS